MRLRFDEISDDTLCPSVPGDGQGHYPLTRAGTPVTMPADQPGPLGQTRYWMLGHCGARLRCPEREELRALEQRSVCAGCLRTRDITVNPTRSSRVLSSAGV